MGLLRHVVMENREMCSLHEPGSNILLLYFAACYLQVIVFVNFMLTFLIVFFASISNFYSFWSFNTLQGENFDI